MPFNYEYDKRLRVGFIGAGEHAYRNILPSFQYAPIDLLALTDTNTERGLAVARQFGAKRFYPNHKALLAKEELDAVFIVVGPDANGLPRYPELAAEVMRAGFHAWIDTPPCSCADDISTFTNACLSKQRYVATGLKRMFAPAYRKVADIMADASFGGASSFSLRYPLALPAEDQRADSRAMAAFLEFVQPYSLLLFLFGECESLSFARSEPTGAVALVLTYRSGLVGTLHLAARQAATSPLEHLEVVGNGGNLVVDNGVRLTYYRPGGFRGDGAYGRVESFIGPDDRAPIVWEPDFSLGQLYNKQLFLEGYVGCVRAFAEQLLAGEAPKQGNLVQILHIMTTIDRIRKGKDKQWISIS